VNPHQIQPKLVQRCALTSPLCVKVSAIGTCLCFIAESVSMRNEEKEEKKKKQKETKFCSLVSQDRLEQFASNLVCRLVYLAGISVANLVEFG